MDSTIPYLGYRISLLSNSDIRYEGTLSGIDSNEATVTLRNVRSMGTEGRVPHREILPSPEVYDCIVFRGQNIKDLTVCGNDYNMDIYQDPAIISAKPVGNGTEDKLQNTQNFYYDDEDDDKVQSAGWGDVYNKPVYTAKDLIDKSVNFKDKDGSKEDGKFGEKNSGKFDKRDSQRRGRRNNTGRYKRNNPSDFKNKTSHDETGGKTGKFTSDSGEKSKKFDNFGEKTGKFDKSGDKSGDKFDKVGDNNNQFNDEFDFEQANAVFKKEQRAVSGTYTHSNFFDNISSDIHEVVKDKNSQRKLDLDTFGESAQNYKPYNRYNNQGRSKRNNHRNSFNPKGKKGNN